MSRKPRRFCFPAVLGLLCAAAASSASEIQFQSDLEDADAACFSTRPPAGCSGWNGIHDACISICRGEQSHSGNQAIKIEFTKNENYGGAWRIMNTRHIFTRFYDYYGKDFDFAAGMKIHRLSAFNETKQINDFDIILQTKADEPGANYCGLTEAKYLALSFNGGPHDWGSVEVRWTPVRERWYAIETEVKLNTPGSSDGELRIWIDGRLMAEKKGMNLTDKIASPINRVLFGGWYSNSAAGKNPCPDPVKPSIRYVDDPVVSTSYIGPMPTVSLGPLAKTRVIAWVLPESGTFQVEYGPTAGYGSSTSLATAANGLYSAVISGLDTNKTYHYRLKSKWNSGYAYVSPDYALSTAPGGAAPATGPVRPRHTPVNLKAQQYDPIPD